MFVRDNFSSLIFKEIEPKGYCSQSFLADLRDNLPSVGKHQGGHVLSDLYIGNYNL